MGNERKDEEGKKREREKKSGRNRGRLLSRQLDRFLPVQWIAVLSRLDRSCSCRAICCELFVACRPRNRNHRWNPATSRAAGTSRVRSVRSWKSVKKIDSNGLEIVPVPSRASRFKRHDWFYARSSNPIRLPVFILFFFFPLRVGYEIMILQGRDFFFLFFCENDVTCFV